MSIFQKSITLIFFAALLIYAALSLKVNPVSQWQTISSLNIYSIEYPSNWSVANVSDGELLIFSDFQGDLSIQDRSSFKETVRIKVTRISKKTVSSIDKLAEQIRSYYPNSKIREVDTKVGKFSAIKLSIDNSDLGRNTFFSQMEILIIDNGENIYEIEGGMFPDVPRPQAKYNLELIRRILNSFQFL